MEIFLDGFLILIKKVDQWNCLGRCLDCCVQYKISLNLKKCQFEVPSDKLLGHIILRAGIAMDPDKLIHILALPKLEPCPLLKVL